MSTTALYKALLEAKVSEKTAERAVEGLAFADNIATKADIAKLEAVITRLEDKLKEKASKADLARLEADITGLKTVVARLEADITDLKTAVARLETAVARLEDKLEEKASKADLANLESKMLRWGIGTAVGMTAVIVASVGLMVNL